MTARLQGASGPARNAVCVMLATSGAERSTQVPTFPWRNASDRAVALNDRIAAMLAASRERGGLRDDWRDQDEAAAALELVRAFVEREVLPCPISILCDPKFTWLAPVWNVAFEDAGMDAYLVEPAEGIPTGLDAIDEDVAYRDRLLGEYEVQLAELRETLIRNHDRLVQILGSKSWRLTRPLRLLGSFLRHGRAADLAADEDAFDPKWYLAHYPDVAASNVDPYVHFVASGKKEGRLPRAPLASTTTPEAGSRRSWWELFVARIGVGGSTKAHTRAVRDASTASDHAFDSEFYLRQYPDIADAGIDPREHYLSHGKAEGRLAVRPRLLISQGGIAFDPARDTVLVVSHEASRTGAPVLSLNLVTSLSKRYNVVAMLLGAGPLTEDFRNGCTWLVGPMDLRGAPVCAAFIIDELLTLHMPRFALVNSIESRVVLEPLARRGVVTISLVHEFAAYTRPRFEFRDALFWADETVFSTPLTRESAYVEFPDFADKVFAVLPQGRCDLPISAQDEDARRRENSRLLAVLRPRGTSDDSFVVLGAGFVQQRKGVDLFIQCASHVMASERGRNCRFVWIGSGYDPEYDMGYSVYLADQLRRSGLDKVVRIIDETSNIDTVYQAADALLLSSRLDPLPNVAIDAMAHGLPVVCFDKTSGIANVLVEEGLREHLVADYLDTQDMASKVLELASSPALRQKIRKHVLEVVDNRFNMESYVASLEKLALDADARGKQRADDVAQIVQSGLFRLDFHTSPLSRPRSLEYMVEFAYLRSWACGIGRRKPFPGFHPGVYRSLNGLDGACDPFADYLRNGQPEGPWKQDLIMPAEGSPVASGAGRVALHIHVYYPDMLPDILARLARNRIRPDLFISVPSVSAKADVEPQLAGYEGTVARLQVVPNRGRDIGPFLTAFGGDWSDYDVVGHLHTKKSLDLNDSSVAFRWSSFLMDNLVGRDHAMADVIVGRLLADPSLGLVYPDDPNVVGWSKNLTFAKELGDRMGLVDYSAEFNFPVGTMFWARTDALKPLIDLGLQWDDYPVEPLGYDGTMLHAIERLLPFVVASAGFRCAVTNVPGVTR